MTAYIPEGKAKKLWPISKKAHDLTVEQRERIEALIEERAKKRQEESDDGREDLR